MKKGFYRLGRACQVAGLMVLPVAIWAGEIGHDERAAIFVFLGSAGVFAAGYLLTRLALKL